MSRFEFQVTWRRQGREEVQSKIFRQRPAMDRFIADLYAETTANGFLPVEEVNIAKRDVGRWERLWELGDPGNPFDVLEA